MYQMAAYCRLSRDDGENKMSESIENQMKIIREYVENSEELELIDSYIDDGFSGMYFSNRPQFQRMMRDIYAGKIQGVITKDISRLGREHIETSNYIERVFPTLGIRFIAILDGLDSRSCINEELAQFKTLFNDMYCRDISKKIRGSLEIQKKRGNFMSGFAPYGYIKDPENKHHFLIDEEAAQVVKKIFYLYLAGNAKGRIAGILNKEGILTPSEYKRKIQGLNYANAKEKPGGKGWSYATIHTMLKNRTYTGDMVQHKTEKISYKVDKCRYIPVNEQIIVEDMHEPIIDKSTFSQVQSLMEKRMRTPGFTNKNIQMNAYAGVLICGDCFHTLQKKSSKNGFECSTYHYKGNVLCKSHFIKKSLLDNILKAEITRHLKTVLAKNTDAEMVIKEFKRIRKSERQTKRNMQVECLQKELEKVRRYIKKTYENYLDHVLNEEEYAYYKKIYTQQENDLQTQVTYIREKEKNNNASGDASKNCIEQLVIYGELEEITREILVVFIDKIVVNGDKSLDILCKYQSPYMDGR